MGRPARSAAKKGRAALRDQLLRGHDESDGIAEEGVSDFSDEEIVAPTTGRKRKAVTKRVPASKKAAKKSKVAVEDDADESEYCASEEEAEESDSAGEEATEDGSSDDEPISPTKKTRNKKAAKKKPARKPRAKGKKSTAPLNPHGLDEDGDYNVWGGGSDDEQVNPDELTRRSGPQPTMEPAPEMLMPLLPFQKEWLAWAIDQENGSVKGGILADEMGMGKTIQAISLIVTARHLKNNPQLPLVSANSFKKAGERVKQAAAPPPHHCASASAGPSTSAAPLPKVKATLVVCPLVAVIQWRSEIARFTSPGSAKVLVYHGPKRNIDFEVLSQYDIVLTTYSIVESEHRKNVMPDKEECKWCGRKYYPDRLKVHLRFFCGPTARKSDKLALQQKKLPRQYKKSMAAIKGKAPLEEPFDLEDDPKAKLKGKAPPPKSKPSGKGKKPVDVSESEAEEPSTSAKGKPFGRGRRGVRFGRVSSTNLATALDAAIDAVDEGPAASPEKSGFSALHSVQWGRIVLDEAHSIKDRRCSTAKAIFAIQSEFKWALSGTPLQNRVGELYSLVRFLRMDPYAYYFCKKCDCKSLDYRFGKDWRKCDDCGHSPLHHLCWWNKYVANPIKKSGYVGEGRKAMLRLKNKVLDAALLRRTKVERAADLALPPRCTLLRKDAFDAREQDFYEALYTQSQSQFATYVDSGTVLNNYAHIFDLLIRLRQAVDHPYLVVHSATAPPTSAGQEKEVALNEMCGICHDPVEDAVVTACKHSFCRACLSEFVAGAGGDAETAKGAGCPTCEKPLTVDLTGSAQAAAVATAASINKRRTSILNRINLGGFQTSTKIEALREEIALMTEDDPSAKGLVFSQFTSMLDLCHFRLEKAGIKCVKLDGSMSMEHRDKMIQDFTNDPDVKVFLMSLKAGGVALNLTVASRVFLMDPWWNPAVEQQAQDRIHRLGQYKPIQVTRFVIENTIEERILKLQEKKQLVFDGTVGGSAEALGRLTAEDLAFLFSS